MTLHAGKRYTLAELPPSIPVFPLTGVLLLPRGRLPLNIFEPRYLAMTEDALASGHRLIGMIQPTEPEKNGPPPLFRSGCASDTDRGEEPRSADDALIKQHQHPATCRAARLGNV